MNNLGVFLETDHMQLLDCVYTDSKRCLYLGPRKNDTNTFIFLAEIDYIPVYLSCLHSLIIRTMKMMSIEQFYIFTASEIRLYSYLNCRSLLEQSKKCSKSVLKSHINIAHHNHHDEQ